MTTAGEPPKKCSYLCTDEEQACSMTKGGIYLPLKEHIEMFCKTPHFLECHQYVRGSKIGAKTSLEEDYRDNGRPQFRRIADLLSLSLANCDEAGRPCQLIDGNACTVDLSPGGMRLESHHRLSTHDLISFTFGPHFSTPNLTGVGQIMWSTAANEPDLFHAGLAFLDATTKQAIGHHMGVPV